jgi:AcrR family transcriptional regulator
VDGRIERGQSTRARLVEAARIRFGTQGFAATSIEAVLADSGVSRGALYHHFESKEALFEAVLDLVEAEVARKVIEAAAEERDPKRAVLVGCLGFLAIAPTEEVRRIVLTDAPAVVGWARWREIDARHAFGHLRLGVAVAADGGALDPGDVDSVAHILLASLLELALLVAFAVEPQSAAQDVQRAMTLLVERLLGGDENRSK